MTDGRDPLISPLQDIRTWNRCFLSHCLADCRISRNNQLSKAPWPLPSPLEHHPFKSLVDRVADNTLGFTCSRFFECLLPLHGDFEKVFLNGRRPVCRDTHSQFAHAQQSHAQIASHACARVKPAIARGCHIFARVVPRMCRFRGQVLQGSHRPS